MSPNADMSEGCLGWLTGRMGYRGGGGGGGGG